MAEPDLLPFYQHFYSEHLFVVPETGSANANIPAQPAVPPRPEVVSGDTPLTKKFYVSGENKKGLVLLFSLPAAEFATLPQNVFLTKVLAAIQHMPADVAYVNLEPGYKINIFDLSKETKLEQVVAFGKDLVDLAIGFQIHLYKPAAVGQVPLLLADPLEYIENDVNRKKNLWSGLQAIFLNK
ncbi:hypothetical protein AAE02nite_44580 [Adhaeribacter aerolatus]|uniref:Uncharacterized protein n=1 Tax=Adhaeribacter aerolatus TaxID=670289 RepID=A0A512B4A8_9BACT|nr:hypothetical protein [Adhaeribacter aerolatus]GEO06794.1 hypothetical protein AAE02nite_44580 [Adhaeribacter aerolatus]